MVAFVKNELIWFQTKPDKWFSVHLPAKQPAAALSRFAPNDCSNIQTWMGQIEWVQIDLDKASSRWHTRMASRHSLGPSMGLTQGEGCDPMVRGQIYALMLYRLAYGKTHGWSASLCYNAADVFLKLSSAWADSVKDVLLTQVDRRPLISHHTRYRERCCVTRVWGTMNYFEIGKFRYDAKFSFFFNNK